MENVASVNKPKFAKKSNLVYLKPRVGKLDVDKLTMLPAGLS